MIDSLKNQIILKSNNFLYRNFEAVAAEKEYGTMESLLATPVTSLEIIFGKITSYIVVVYIQLLLTIIFAKVIFGIIIVDSIILLLVATFPFIYC